jgi:hypothetical protein
MKRALLFFLLIPCLGAAEPGRDPFGPDGSGFDLAEPGLESFTASLPPAAKAPGREVVVQALMVRESGRVAPWPAEPLAEWLLDREDDCLSVKTKLNEAAWQEKRTWLKTDPAGTALAKSCWLGAVFCVRADETARPGQYLLHYAWSRRGLDGWVETGERHEPLFESSAMQGKLDLTNRWFRMDGASRTIIDAGESKESRMALYLRVEDGLPPAPKPLVQEPSAVVPAH